ncbi:type II toxin-antitoxin system VapC family toxin [Mucilaginibacter sp. 21P]|uniref:type II toxin-antitoxin system VapC family toxin n=1 Tax=Mucilaginibacter sp. 21P TaxID=2778902 RepID=UPI001C56C049|nr:type II toxin-antitoxin system VapC family toxin [Mucilaginibacter sp. 21P]QXV67265.1 type II toxin-antitoxin system VapC family toxin [Mucilaginibacter sp. 21P]
MKSERNGIVIFDTNILIYLSNYTLSPEKLFLKHASISVITKIEALGFAFKNAEEHDLIVKLCNELSIIHLNDAIVEATINIRRANRIKLPDAVIYATALVQQQPLLTHNVADFKSIDNKVELIDPFAL